MLRNPTFVVQSRTFEQLSLQKATFDCFLTNFRVPLILRNYGNALWKISNNMWKARGWIARYCRKLRCLVAVGQKIAEKPDLHFCVLLRSAVAQPSILIGTPASIFESLILIQIDL